MYHLPRTAPERFEGAACLAEVAGAFDQVYLTVSSTALKAGTWLAELARATGDATVVVLQSNLDDRAFVAERFGADRIVDGIINFLSYHAPLPGETRFAEPGMAYWFFPGKAPFSGARAGDVVAALAAGKLPVKRVQDVARTAAFPSAVLSAFVAALEASSWSFATMRSAGNAKLGARLAARPLAFRALMRLAPRVAPVDLETYLRVHFTKVGDQMHEGFAKYVALARAASLPAGALEELSKRLPAPS